MVTTPNGKVRITFTLSLEHYDQLKALAKHSERPKGQIIRDAVKDLLNISPRGGKARRKRVL